MNTGRYAHIFLKNSEIVEGISFEDSCRVKDLLSNGKHSLLLYPGDRSLNVSQDQISLIGDLQIFVLDATWPLARKMLRHSPSLQKLDRISFDVDKKSKFTIKHQPHDACLSTIESMAVLLRSLSSHNLENAEDGANRMDILLENVVQFHQSCASDTSIGGYRRKKYSEPSVRRKSKKWDKRNLLFKDGF